MKHDCKEARYVKENRVIELKFAGSEIELFSIPNCIRDSDLLLHKRGNPSKDFFFANLPEGSMNVSLSLTG